MAFDAGFLRAVVFELNRDLADGKVDKIGQPSADEVVLQIRHFGETKRLLIRAGASLSRLSLTGENKDNPATPPMFCMLLRKHLGGAKLLRVEQPGYERIARIAFSGYDEMGYETEKYLVAEIMGKYSNLMLLDGNDRILAALRTVDFSTSRVRQVLPGMTYELPPAQDKREPLTETREGFLSALAAADPEQQADKYLTAAYLGTSVQVAREIVYRATGRTDTRLFETRPTALADAFFAWHERLRENRYEMTLMRAADGAPLEYCYAPLTYFGAGTTCETYPDAGALLDACFGERERLARVHNRASDLFGLIERATARLARKTEAQEGELREARQGDLWQRRGDLLTANLWRVQRGDTALVTEDYYEDPPVTVTIQLDGRLSPAANAQRFYKYYTKAKHARVHLEEEIARNRAEMEYLATVRDALLRAQSEQDLAEIREELWRAGYAARMKGYAPPKQRKARPLVYLSPNGYRVLVGRNNLQNDMLTFHTAARGDLWFHVKGAPGSHVILVAGGEEPPAEDYTFAATLAAIHSSLSGDAVPVDYTRVRFVKKPPVAKPGYVTYSTNYTAYVSTADKDRFRPEGA